MPRRDEPTIERFAIGGYYLEQPHPDRGGNGYACRYDGGTGEVRRRSLRERDFEQAKIKLAALVAAAPQGDKKDDAASPGEVLTLAVFKAYMDGHGATIASEELAERAVELFTLYLTRIKKIDATVSFWTPAQQTECLRWLRQEYGHAASYIVRCFNVMRSAFVDATRVKIRTDAVGNPVEAALISRAPEIVMREGRIATELKIPQQRRNARRSRSTRWPACSTAALRRTCFALRSCRSPHGLVPRR
jgi:hypothetical protein